LGASKKAGSKHCPVNLKEKRGQGGNGKRVTADSMKMDRLCPQADEEKLSGDGPRGKPQIGIRIEWGGRRMAKGTENISPCLAQEKVLQTMNHAGKGPWLIRPRRRDCLKKRAGNRGGKEKGKISDNIKPRVVRNWEKKRGGPEVYKSKKNSFQWYGNLVGLGKERKET